MPVEKENSPPRSRSKRDNVYRQGDHDYLSPGGEMKVENHENLAAASASNEDDEAPKPLSGVNQANQQEKNKYNTGNWSKEERLLFLKGLRAYGWGRWKNIGATYVPTRCV